MEANYSFYDFNQSIERIPEILDTQDTKFADKDAVPSRSTLTYTNGFYVKISSMFVDMRGSKDLAEKHTRPVLAKIYRSFISELVAVLKGHPKVQEVSIEGDCVWGVFDTPLKDHIDHLFGTAAQAASLIDILNYFYRQRNITTINAGIGLAYGRALFIKAGYKGSSISEVVWAGDVVTEAAQLCSYGASTSQDSRVMLSDTVYSNLREDYKKLCARNRLRGCYHADLWNVDMNDWLKRQQ